MSTVTTIPRPTYGATVADWRQYLRNAYRMSGNKPRGWLGCAKRWAETHGRAIVLKADDTLLVLTRDGEKIRQRTYKPGTWKWSD